MKTNPRNRILILVSVGLLVGSSIIANSSPIFKNKKIDSDPFLRTSKISGKIYIDNNWTDTKNAGICTGSGTLTDPYVIEDLEINANNIGSCILIKNTNVYLKIENCTIINSGNELVDAGIFLDNLINAEITDNTFLNNYRGINLNNSHNCTIHNNFLNENSIDIRLIHSNNTVMYLNDCVSQGLNLFFYNSTFLCRTPNKITYIYGGNTFTEYLGNFWFDYPGDDENNDGIGDSPLTFYNSHVVHVDHYPLMQTTDHYFLNSSGIIPGYNLYFIIGIISTLLFVLSNRKNKKTRIS